MKSNIKNLLTVVFMLQAVSVSANEYIPPPPGPYQSVVVINTVEGNSSQKHQIYKFPQAELFQSKEPDYNSANTPSALPGLAEKPVEQYSNSYKNPSIEPMMPPLDDVYRGSDTSSAIQPWYGSQGNNNPWPANMLHPNQPYQRGWDYQNYGYGYYPYANQYRNETNMFNLPFSAMPSPWAMRPSKPYTGR